jgi:hypothetical protein
MIRRCSGQRCCKAPQLMDAWYFLRPPSTPTLGGGVPYLTCFLTSFRYLNCRRALANHRSSQLPRPAPTEFVVALITRWSGVHCLPPPPSKRVFRALLHMHKPLTSIFGQRLVGLWGQFVGTYSALAYAAHAGWRGRGRPVRCGIAAEGSVGWSVAWACMGHAHAVALITFWASGCCGPSFGRARPLREGGRSRGRCQCSRDPCGGGSRPDLTVVTRTGP